MRPQLKRTENFEKFDHVVF